MTLRRILRGISFRIRELLKYRLVKGPFTYNQDGLATRHNCDFIHDQLFAEAYRLAEKTGSFGASRIHWRVYIVCWVAERAKSLDGDFVECGVNKGSLARAIIHFINFGSLPKRFYLLDTFSGLVDECISDDERSMGCHAGGYEECFAEVQQTFKSFDNVVLVRGVVPHTLTEVKSEKIAFLSIDMNCALPEIAAAEYFWDKLSSGAIIVVDDYGWQRSIAQKRAFDEFAMKRNTRVLPLPTGQGLIFKP